MRLDVSMILTTLLMAGCLGLAGCGGEQKSSNAVQMKDLEVVDGTTTDAMTDLDGVQSEAPAMAVPGVKADNATAPATKDETAGNAAAPATPKFFRINRVTRAFRRDTAASEHAGRQ